MKKILSMAALALIMAGCSNDEETPEINPGEATNAVPVQISQKVAGVETKAAVGIGNDVNAVILMADAQNFSGFTPNKENKLNSSNKFDKDADRANYSTTTFKAQTTAGKLNDLTPALYFPITGSSDKTVYIAGVAPQGNVTATAVEFTDIDGLQDVMYAAAATATLSSSSSSQTATPELEFKHKTTQLTFAAKLAEELTDTEWDGKAVTVKSITIQNAQLPKSLSFGAGIVNYADAASFVVKGISTTLTNASAVDVSSPVMVMPTTNILVNLTLSVGGTEKTYNNLPVLKDGSSDKLTTVEGKSHKVTFTITAPTTPDGATAVTVKAKVVDWAVGDAGSVEVK